MKKTTNNSAATNKPANKPAEPKFSVITDKRGRMTYKMDNKTLAMIQPCKTHLTVYVSKFLCLKPEEASAAVPEIKTVAVVNPTYKLKDGKDPFSVKMTAEAIVGQANDIVVGLLAKSVAVAKAAKERAEATAEPEEVN